MYKTKATVNVKGSDGTIIAHQDYDKIVFEGNFEENGKPAGGTDPELLKQAIDYVHSTLSKDKDGNVVGSAVREMLSRFTYATDLGMRAGIRQQLLAAVAGPDKAVDKAIATYMTMRAAIGRPVTEEEARAKLLVD